MPPAGLLHEQHRLGVGLLHPARTRTEPQAQPAPHPGAGKRRQRPDGLRLGADLHQPGAAGRQSAVGQCHRYAGGAAGRGCRGRLALRQGAGVGGQQDQHRQRVPLPHPGPLGLLLRFRRHLLPTGQQLPGRLHRRPGGGQQQVCPPSLDAQFLRRHHLAGAALDVPHPRPAS